MLAATAIALKGQDLLVAMKLAAQPGKGWIYSELGQSLGLSTSETRLALLRADAAGLASADQRTANRPALLEFLEHGARYAFPAVRGRRGRGMPTGIMAPPLSASFAANPDAQLVWPYGQGTSRGETLAAIYPAVPHAAEQDEALYELLVLLDGIRVGGARVREVARGLLQERLQ